MSAHPRPALGPVFALLSALTFATSGTFAAALLAIGWTPGAAVLFRIGVSAAVLLVPGILSLRGRWHLLAENGREVVLFGLFGVALAQLSYFTAVQYLSVGVALLIEYLSPVLVVLWLVGPARAPAAAADGRGGRGGDDGPPARSRPHGRGGPPCGRGMVPDGRDRGGGLLGRGRFAP